MKSLQKLGKALMQPVAVLPVAALMLGLGYYIDPHGWGANSPIAAFLIKAGGAVVDNIPWLFAVGVAYGLSRDKDGAAALSGLVAMFVLTSLLSPGSITMLRGGVEPLPAEGFGKIANAFTGIISGIVAAACYNKFHNKQLPVALSFFSGRRMTPIVTSFVMILVAAVLYFIWPVVYSALVRFGEFIVKLGPAGAGIYGFANRMLIPSGLHHALNAVFWFDIAGINDLNNFINGAKALQEGTAVIGQTGMYQAGFFPIMMFGLPAAALAMYHTAKPNRKKEAYGLLLAGAVASFVTGVTEPLEFAFMFLAPVLYLIHAVLTGVSLFVASLLKTTAGFGFSAGLFDYLLSLKNPVANKPWMLLILGVIFAVIYYGVFRFFISRFNLKTPGREDDVQASEGNVLDEKTTDFRRMAEVILQGLGGKENIDTLDYCITRLRVETKDYTKVNEKQIKSSGVAGVIRPSQKSVQVVVGPQVQFVYDELKKML